MQITTCNKNLAAIEAERLKKESLQKEIEIAKSNALEVEQRMEAKKLEGMSADKLALLDKFGYEIDDEEDVEEDTGVTKISDHAPKQSAEKPSQPSKKELRAETAKAKADRNAKKEERRKRATKGERRR